MRGRFGLFGLFDQHVAGRTAVGIDTVDRRYLVAHALHVAERVDGTIVDVRDDETLFHSRPGQNSVRFDAYNLHAALDFQLLAELRAGIAELAAQSGGHIDRFAGD